MMQSDFNPLNVLAAAASLQSACINRVDSGGESGQTGDTNQEECGTDDGIDGDGGRGEDDKESGSCSRKDAAEKGSNDISEPLTRSSPPDVVGSEQVIDAKTLPLTVNKNQVADHSYAYICQLNSLKRDCDEGYSSRSSVESEDEEHCTSGVGNNEKQLGSPNIEKAKPKDLDKTIQSVFAVPRSKKTTKILILSKDGKIPKLVRSKDCVFIENSGGDRSVLKSIMSPEPAVRAAQEGSANLGVARIFAKTVVTSKSIKTSCDTVSQASTVVDSSTPKQQEVVEGANPESKTERGVTSDNDALQVDVVQAVMSRSVATSIDHLQLSHAGHRSKEETLGQLDSITDSSIPFDIKQHNVVTEQGVVEQQEDNYQATVIGDCEDTNCVKSTGLGENEEESTGTTWKSSSMSRGKEHAIDDLQYAYTCDSSERSKACANPDSNISLNENHQQAEKEIMVGNVQSIDNDNACQGKKSTNVTQSSAKTEIGSESKSLDHSGEEKIHNGLDLSTSMPGTSAENMDPSIFEVEPFEQNHLENENSCDALDSLPEQIYEKSTNKDMLSSLSDKTEGNLDFNTSLDAAQKARAVFECNSKFSQLSETFDSTVCLQGGEELEAGTSPLSNIAVSAVGCPLPASPNIECSDETSSSSNSSEECSPAFKKINIPIGSSLSNSENNCDSGWKESTSIGTVGSLSLNSVERAASPGSLGSETFKIGQSIRIQGSDILPSSQTPALLPGGSIGNPFIEMDDSRSSTFSKFTSSPGDSSSPDDVGSPVSVGTFTLEDYSASAQRCQAYVTKRQKSRVPQSIPSTLLSGAVQSKGRLHPLIDHDYCCFISFNAQIQSSIISTTECNTKTERKYSKKAKAARTKAVRSVPPKDGNMKLEKAGRGRPKKKTEDKLDKTLEKQTKPSLLKGRNRRAHIKSDGFDSSEEIFGETRTSAGRKKGTACKEHRSYVKITGSYQDEFVYFATKNKRCRPRKSLEDESHNLPAKVPAVGGINVFDWYKDLSRSDKSSRFGMDTDSANSARDSVLGVEDTGVKSTGPALQESDVAELVCELSNIVTRDTITTTTDYPLITSVCEKPGSGVPTKEEDMPVDLNVMAEQVRSMLNSMNESDLQMLEKLGNNGSHADTNAVLTDTSFDNLLPSFNSGQSSSGAGFSDLDDINDGDLLSSDLSNMNVLIGDLSKSPAGHSASQHSVNTNKDNSVAMVTHDPSRAMLDLSLNRLDKSELFPEISVPSLPIVASAAAPELTVVSMYWNDLPGLLIAGKEYVRLVDIHKQMLPAKDTGILKKRCQMMGLTIANCSELQRDFLIRYANAAKSKSTVIVDKECAKTLISFYVEPRARVSKSHSEDHQDTSSPTVSEVHSEDSKGDVSSPVMPSLPSAVIERPQEIVVEQPVAPAASVDLKSIQQTNAVLKKTDDFQSTKTLRKKRKSEMDQEFHPSTPDTCGMGSDVKRSERLKHKKVKYAEMIQGNLKWIDDTSPRKRNSVPLEYAPDTEQENSSDLYSVPVHNECTSVVGSECNRVEISKLNTRKYKILKRNQPYMRSLRKELGKRRLAQRRLVYKEQVKLKSVDKSAQLVKSSPPKSKRKLQETHEYTRKYNHEHCYAACPDGVGSGEDTVQNPEAEMQIEMNEAQTDCHITVEVSSSQSVSKSTSDHSSAEVVTEVSPISYKKKAAVEYIDVVHRDNDNRSTHRGRSQEGILFVGMYKAKDSPCIRCKTCNEILNIKKFLKHQHRFNNPDELVEVSLPQRLEKKNIDLSGVEKEAWDKFVCQMNDFSSTVLSPSNGMARSKKRERKSAHFVMTVVQGSRPLDDITDHHLSSEAKHKDQVVSVGDERLQDKSMQDVAKVGVVQTLSCQSNGRDDKGARAFVDLTSAANAGEPCDESNDKSQNERPAEKSSLFVGKGLGFVGKSPGADNLTAKVSQRNRGTIDSPGLESHCIRHSTRIRKKKQLHPIEKYVFSRSSIVDSGPKTKR